MSLEETEDLYEKAGLQMVSIRLPSEVIEKLKAMAGAQGLKYQPYVRKVLIGHVSEDRQSLEDQVARLESQIAELTAQKAS